MAQMCCLGFAEVLLNSVAVFGWCRGGLCTTLSRCGCLIRGCCLQTRALLHMYSPKCFVSKLSLDPLVAFFRSGFEFTQGLTPPWLKTMLLKCCHKSENIGGISGTHWKIYFTNFFFFFSSWCVLLSWSSCNTTLNTQGLKFAWQEWVLAVMLELSEGLCCTGRTIAELYCKYAMTAGTTKIEMKAHGNSSGSLAVVSCWCIGSLSFDRSYHKGDTEKWLLEQQIPPEGIVKKSFKKPLQNQKSLLCIT